MDIERLQIVVLVLIVCFSNTVALLIELFHLIGQLSGAVAVQSLHTLDLEEYAAISESLIGAEIVWILTILLGLHLMVPLLAIAFDNGLSGWFIFSFGSVCTAFGTFHHFEHGLAGDIYAILLTFLILTISGIYGVYFAFSLTRKLHHKSYLKWQFSC